MKKLLLILSLFAGFISNAQKSFEVKGLITDTAGKALQGVSVKIYQGKDSVQSLTDKTGVFSFSKINSDSFNLVATFSGLDTFSTVFKRPTTSLVFNVPPFMLSPYVGMLEGIVVASVKPVIIKEDTVQFSAAAYKVREGSTVDEVIKKLPGVTVDDEGNIETQGKKVSKIRVNGKDFMGDDVKSALEGLPADIVDNIQMIDDYGDQAAITGVKSGEPRKILNINIQKNKNKGKSGNLSLAGGNSGRYLGSGFLNLFKEERQISLQGTIGNTSSNMSRGGRGGGGGFGGGGAVTVTKMGSINYRDKWGKNLSVYGSYNISGRKSNSNTSSYTQDFNPLNIRTTDRSSSNVNRGLNHKLEWNMEYNMTPSDYIKFSPNFNLGTSGSNSSSRSETSRPHYYTLNNSISSSNGNSNSFGGSFLYNHKFKKPGRNLSFTANMNSSESENDRNSNNAYNNVDSTYDPYILKDTVQRQIVNGVNTNQRNTFGASYLEPLDKKKTTFVELSYSWSKSSNESVKEIYDIVDSLGKNVSRFNTIQSDLYNYYFINQKTGVTLRGRHEKYNYNVGIQAQPVKLWGTSISKNYTTLPYERINWVPSARFVYKFNKSNEITGSFDGSAREPNFFQLQPVTDSTNLYNIVKGNPNLKSEFNNRITIRYNKSNQKGSSILFELAHDRLNDKIVSSRTNNITGTGRTTTYLNTDGFYGYNGNVNLTQPFYDRKFVVSVFMNANFDNNISFTDGLKNKGQNWNLRPGADFRLDLHNIVDVSLRGSFNYYETSTKYATYTTENIAKSLRLSLNGTNYFGDLGIGYSFSKTINYNFGKDYKENPSNLNLSAEYRFLKKKNLTVRFQTFDLFNSYTGLTRTVSETTITDSRSSQLGRLFLLSLNWRLMKYGSGGGGQGGRRSFGGGGYGGRMGGGF